MLNKKIDVTVTVNKEAKEKFNAVMKEVAYTSMSVVTGVAVGSVLGATVQKIGNHSKCANIAGSLTGLGVTFATSYTMYDRLKKSDAVYEDLYQTIKSIGYKDVEDEILDDDEEGGDEEEA